MAQKKKKPRQNKRPPKKIIAEGIHAIQSRIHSLRTMATQHLQAKAPNEAEPLLQEAYLLDQTNADILHLLGISFHLQGNDDKAIEYYRAAISLDPKHFLFYYHLGVSLHKLGRFSEAIISYRQAYAIAPESIDILENLGCALLEVGEIDESTETLQRVVVARPNSYKSHLNLGKAYVKIRQQKKALTHFSAAVNLNPNLPEIHQSLGQTLMAGGAMTPAEAHFMKALELQPDNADIIKNLAAVLANKGRIDEALDLYKKASRLAPNDAALHSNRLYPLHYRHGDDAHYIFNEHIVWNKQHTSQLPTPNTSFSNKPDVDRRLRIGYVSPDFRYHSVCFFLEPIIRSHDKSNFETICYSNVDSPDDMTLRLKGESDIWRDINKMPDNEVFELIKNDEIDILVDLAGHTDGNRLLVFARKPAPVQVTYLGYPNTTGLSTIDYRITDNWADPEDITDKFHTEELIRLPEGFLCFLPPANSPAPAHPPLSNGDTVTFGSFNYFSKISPSVVKSWAQILLRVPGSNIFIKSKPLDDEEVKQSLYKQFEIAGIEPGRIKLLGFKETIADHLSLYNSVDIALDTYPYNGTTTTCEALWMGVPVIVLAGKAHVARVGVSLLSVLGLTEYIAESEEEYIQKAVQLAQNKSQLQKFHAELRGRMTASNLTNAEKFTRSLENAYRNMWIRWCR